MQSLQVTNKSTSIFDKLEKYILEKNKNVMTHVKLFKIIWIDEYINESADIIAAMKKIAQFKVCPFENIESAA